MKTTKELKNIPAAGNENFAAIDSEVNIGLFKEIIFANTIFVMMSGRIPVPFSDFHEFLSSVLPWLQQTPTGGSQTNGARLGMSSGDITACATWLSNWTSGDTLNPKIYENQADKKKRNMETTDAYHTFEKDFNTWFHKQLDIMSVSPNLTSNDRLKLNIKEKPTSYHRSTTPIATSLTVSAKTIGSGVIKLDCRTSEDASRANLPDDADAVEITYACYGKDCPGQVELVPKWKETEPVSPTSCGWRESHSKALFEMNVSINLSGYNIKGWARYIDSKNESRAGKWSNPFMLVVP